MKRKLFESQCGDAWSAKQKKPKKKAKKKEVYSLLIQNFQSSISSLCNDLVVDEIRIPLSHEQCGSKNHNRDKPDKWAIEFKSLNTPEGYLYVQYHEIINS